MYLIQVLYNLGKNSVPDFKWFSKKSKYSEIYSLIETPGYQVIEKENHPSNLSKTERLLYFIRYASMSKIVLAYNKNENTVVIVIHFRFDRSYLSLPYHDLLETFKNLAKPMKIEDVKVIKLNSILTLFTDSDISTIDLLLPYESSPLNIIILNDELYNIPYIKSIPIRNK